MEQHAPAPYAIMLLCSQQISDLRIITKNEVTTANMERGRSAHVIISSYVVRSKVARVLGKAEQQKEEDPKRVELAAGCTVFEEALLLLPAHFSVDSSHCEKGWASSNSGSSERSMSGQRTQTIASIALFCFWLIFRFILFISTSSSSPSSLDTFAKSAITVKELEISQSVPDLIVIDNAHRKKSGISVPAAVDAAKQQQQQLSQPPQNSQLPPPGPPKIYNKQQISGSETIQHGATLEHPSLRNKMRRYREANRKDDNEIPITQLLQSQATEKVKDKLSPYHQQFVDVIRYIEVPSGRDDVKRYAAMVRSKQLSDNRQITTNEYEPVTIRTWMTIVYSGTDIGNRAATQLSEVIASSPYDSMLFEVPGCTWWSSAEKPFEFVLVNQPSLKVFAEGNPDRYAFEEHFSKAQSCSSNGDGSPSVCSFPNLGRDATLISPLPQPNINDTTYSHLSSFIRNAPKEQISQFWKLAAKTYIDALKYKHERYNEHVGTWFSTNGMGVAWLHLRLDSVPKYYSYHPFTTLGKSMLSP